MPQTTAEEKQQLRQLCRQIRRDLGEEVRARASQAICAQIERWEEFQHAQSLLAYLPIKAEVDLRPLLERHPEKHFALPRILPEAEGRMVFHPYDPARLVRHPFGMDEPAADLPLVPENEIELCLTPGLAYDRQGWRLGYGGGYYDRFLSRFTGVSLGVVFQALLLESIPHGEFDVPVGWVVTEAGLSNCPIQACHFDER
jgi:5-formyltetrahydrofolate cyclo-ligase